MTVKLDYSDFDVRPEPGAEATKAASAPTLVQAEAVIIGVQTAFSKFLHDTLPHLTQEQLRILIGKLPVDLMDEAGGQAYDANFSVADELTLQIQAVKALRQHVFPNGRFNQDGSVREAKEVLTTCNQMIRTLMDSHERIMNLERMRAIEAATLEALAEVSDDMKEQFLVRLEKKLAEIE